MNVLANGTILIDRGYAQGRMRTGMVLKEKLVKAFILIGLINCVMLLGSLPVSGQDSQRQLSNEERAKLQDEYARSFFRFSVLGKIIDDKTVTDDLQVVGTQKAAIKKIIEEYGAKLSIIQIEYMEEERAVFVDQSISEQQRKAAFSEMQLKRARLDVPITHEAIKKIEAELLPHQFERLNQLVNQMIANKKPYSRYSGLINLFGELEVPKDKQAEVKKELVEIQKEYDKRFAELQKKYRQELVQRLPADARKKFSKVFGETDTESDK